MFGRQPLEERQYPVSGRHLRGYKGAFARAGFPVQIMPDGCGGYIMIVSLPASMPQEIDPYSLPPRRQRNFDARQLVTTVLLFALLAGAGWVAYSMFARAQPSLAGAPVEVGGMALNADGTMAQPTVWDWIDTVHLPTLWGSPAQQPAAPEIGFRWPWQDAQDAVQDTTDSISAVVTGILWLLGGLVVLLVLFFARGFVSAVLGAAAGLFNRR